MKRRTFLKAGLLAILAMYGFPVKVSCFSGNSALAVGRHVSGYYPFKGVYSVALAGDQLLMPDAFPRALLQENFILIVPECNTTVLLVPEASDEWKRMEIMFNENEKDGLFYLRQSIQITGDGMLCLPEKVRRFAGIRTSVIEVIGHGNMIEIHDSRCV